MLALFSSSCALQHSAVRLAAARTAPRVVRMSTLPSVLDGGLLDSSGAVLDDTSPFAGKRVALYFTAGWCPCAQRDSNPDPSDLEAGGSPAPPGLRVVDGWAFESLCGLESLCGQDVHLL